MDNTFANRCTIRKTLIHTHRHQVLAANPRAHTAVLELYTWLTRTYLPTRFPSVYTPSSDGCHLRNNVTGADIPLRLCEGDAEFALQVLGENVDDEFLILLPSERPEDEGKYRLEAFVTCFPSGFNTRSKLNMLLSEIHTPIPGYAQKYVSSIHHSLSSPLSLSTYRQTHELTTISPPPTDSKNQWTASSPPSPSAKSSSAQTGL